ncbi:hypothetical protein ES288_D06G128600v1 [Gossypium darwinii]|uniref:Uncharacterized protein n=1 Tax=Gossypium darwinii TaxID=34276 RepID=A0A5D2C7U3_GOSDA|nr:hypothetical protein ES288_D06G128600v1 [Gossypium darwinii]
MGESQAPQAVVVKNKVTLQGKNGFILPTKSLNAPPRLMSQQAYFRVEGFTTKLPSMSFFQVDEKYDLHIVLEKTPRFLLLLHVQEGLIESVNIIY